VLVMPKPSAAIFVTSLLQRGYDGELLGNTFSRAVFVGNGLTAGVAGLVAHTLVEILGTGPVISLDPEVPSWLCAVY